MKKLNKAFLQKLRKKAKQMDEEFMKDRKHIAKQICKSYEDEQIYLLTNRVASLIGQINYIFKQIEGLL